MLTKLKKLSCPCRISILLKKPCAEVVNYANKHCAKKAFSGTFTSNSSPLYWGILQLVTSALNCLYSWFLAESQGRFYKLDNSLVVGVSFKGKKKKAQEIFIFNCLNASHDSKLLKVSPATTISQCILHILFKYTISVANVTLPLYKHHSAEEAKHSAHYYNIVHKITHLIQLLPA